MLFSILREGKTKSSTYGKLLINDVFKAYTLERVNCIPVGNYDLTITFSNRFKKDMILVNNVKGFEGIRFHGGNKASDSQGCVLVGKNRIDKDTIQGCKEVLDELFKIVKENKVVKLEIKDNENVA